MSTDTHSVESKVASDGPREATAVPDQPDTQKSSGQKLDMEAIFKEAWEKSEKMTDEEKLKKFPWLKNDPPPGVDAATAMRILEEIEREEAAEGVEDKTAGTGEGKGF